MRPLLIIFFFLQMSFLKAQELNCSINIQLGNKVRTTERGVYDDMENSFEQFFNNRKWTTDQFKVHERIKCNINLVIDDSPSPGQHSASVQIQSARPIFGSNYESIVLNFADRDWQFEYVESQPLDFSDNNYNSNITSILAFYAYIIIGFDYDTYSELGGTTYFQKALNVVTNAQQSNRPGWKSLENNRNRYWLIENLTNKRMEPIRKGLYTYHRLAMDTYVENEDQGREKIIPILKDLQSIKKQYPASILVISFLDAKSDELINIYSKGDINIRRDAFSILSEIDPSNRDSYNDIVGQ